MYELLALVGFIGLAALASLGFVHHTGGDHGGTAHSAGGHAHGGHHILAGAKGLRMGNPSKALSIFPSSPMDLFSLALGGGLAGLAAKDVAEPVRAAIALLGALLFQFGIAKPLLGLFLKFSTRPSDGLAGTVARAASAETRFDGEGRGLVALELDGETIQVLARLEPDELAAGVRVGRGDVLVVTSVDERRNSVVVTRSLNL